MDTTFTMGAPHEEAMQYLLDKSPIARSIFKGLLPELRGRAFTVAGVEGAHVLQSIRDTLATLPEGKTYDDVKEQLVEELDPYLGDGAEVRADLIIRMNGFQAFNASNWQVAQADEDTTHLQYLATEDDRVRDTHLALNGLVLPKDDPFWDDHLPPWEWGCRCRVRAMNPDLVAIEQAKDEDRAPEDRNVLDGAVLDQLHNGTLIRDNRAYDVSSPSASDPDAFQWHPDNLKLSLDDLEKRYDPETWSDFKSWAQGAEIGDGVSVWDWLNGS